MPEDIKNKTPPERGGVLFFLERKSFNGVLQGLGSAEFRHSHRLDLNRGPRTRVPTGATGAHLSLEDAQARNRDLIAFLEAVGDHSDDRFYRALSIGFRATDR